MSRRRLVIGAATTLLVAGLGGFAVWLATLPAAAPGRQGDPIAAGETAEMLRALAPARRARPRIALLAINDASETTDVLMPYGILRRADVADVQLVSTREGPVSLYPVLAVNADATIADFDARYPDGADYVIVPAMSRNDDPAALAWLVAQAGKGARVLAVCAGARVVAEAGLLDGRRATTHWYYLDGLLDRHRSVSYVPDRRFVVDGPVATTTGITASLPMMLTLVESIAGTEKAASLARDFGLEHWDARHVSASFRFNRPFAATVLGNRLAFWKREPVTLALRDGVDEVALALVADAWSRTYRSPVKTIAEGTTVTSRGGLTIVPDAAGRSPPATASPAVAIDDRPAARQLDSALQAIADRQGPRTASIVAMQLEYVWPQPR